MNKKYLKNLNISELKELCKKKKIKGYSKLNKEEIIKLIMQCTVNSVVDVNMHSLKGGSINKPIIRIYTYKILNFNQTSNGFQVNNMETSQKFNKFYPSLNSMGIVYPKEYINESGKSHIFSLNSYISNEKYYSIDHLISNKLEVSEINQHEPKTILKLSKTQQNLKSLVTQGSQGSLVNQGSQGSHNLNNYNGISFGGSIKNIENYYNFYLDKKTKVKSFINDGNPFYNNNRANDIYNTLNDASLITEHYIKKNIGNGNGNGNGNDNDNDINERLNGAYIFNIEIHENEKLIIFGDLHGSYHSFFRIFTRLHILGVINFPEFIINEGYRIIFLGDIADRGQYALEIFYIISKFIINNNTDTLLKIIINRGNHEDPSQWESETYGFNKEVKQKFEHKQYSKTSNNILKTIINLLSYCSSAIILRYKNNKYWLCHGGFPMSYSISDLNSDIFNIPRDISNFVIPTKPITFYKQNKSINPVYDIPYQIRWSDFTNDFNSTITEIGRPTIGMLNLRHFLRVNKINFIIRGHTDNIDNAFLLLNKNSYDIKHKINLSPYLLLNSLLLGKYKINSKILFPTNIYNYNSINGLFQVDGPIVNIITDNWVNSENNNNWKKSTGYSNVFLQEKDKLSKNEYREIYPVLTISTNSDLLRRLNNDSFIVFNFSNDNDFNKLNNDAIIEYFKSFNKTNHKTIPPGVAHNN